MQNETLHPCELMYNIGARNTIYGSIPGTCRITGKQSSGLPFNKWVKDTFTDQAFLKPGTIISNQALFCFDEKSEILQQLTGREKLQRFRTYSHIIHRGQWHICTKANKKKIFDLIVDGAEIVCLTDSGQKHVFFKHKPGMWQLDDSFIIPDIPEFTRLHSLMCDLLRMEFSQGEVITGQYLQYRILKAGLKPWKTIEDQIAPQRGSQLFNFASWLLFT